ncbi:MAG: putative Ig domain-containing protein [Acidobacteriaceae bacterium]|nr:putative Ig domain-containing protein [Acidobacteriaceae bacterium]
MPLTITTDQTLPNAVVGRSYTTTVTAGNGVGALHWSMAAASGVPADGLSLDPQSGVISGTVGFTGTAGIAVTVTDSGTPVRSATKTLFITSYAALQGGSQSSIVTQYEAATVPMANVQGGVPPLHYSLASGSLPPGIRVDGGLNELTGTAEQIGSFSGTLTVQDSFSPPQIASAQLNVTVQPHSFTVWNSLPAKLLLNRPFSGRIVATGGTPPYHFSNDPGGSLPPGVDPVDSSTGQISGTPTTAGTYLFSVTVTDSSVPQQRSSPSFSISVAAPLGRNDTPATATTLPGNGTYPFLSISPYIDPPNGNPVAGDNDYYRLTSLSGSTVHVETQAQQLNPSNPLDTVIEIVDGNGVRFTSCRQPGDTSNNFNSGCMNDDISASPHITDSALDFQVPGSPSTATDFYVRVLDYRGDARPDMQYTLSVGGIVPPLAVQLYALSPTDRGVVYHGQIFIVGGTYPITLSVSSGNLPPGLTLDTNAFMISGIATTEGLYTFSIQATDSSKPPQVAAAQGSIPVVPPLQITSPSTLPSACLNQPYSYTLQASGGTSFRNWGGFSTAGVFLDSTGVLSGTPYLVGTFTQTVGVTDGTGYWVYQTVSLTVNTCP